MSPTIAPVSQGAAPAGPRRLRPRRSTLLVGAVVLAAAALVVLLGAAPRTGDPLDPDNPGPDGAQAVARVLDDSGVDVEVVRGAAALAEAQVDDRTTLLVVSPDLVGERALSEIGGRRDAGAVVVAGAGPGASEALGVPLPTRVRLARPRAASCEDLDLLRGLEVQVDVAFAYAVPGCSTGSGGTVVAPAPAGTDGRGPTLLGADQVLTNDQVLRADNAAVAVRLLGQQPRLVWYVPAVTDLGAEDGVALRTLLPTWIQPGLYVGGLAALALLLWRVRRLGPLAVEPLPVVVRASETTHSLGRLYRRSGDRGHAADALREATRRRVARQLRLGPTAAVDDVVRATARHLGRRDEEVAALLDPAAGPPATDHALITLAADLAALEREAART